MRLGTIIQGDAETLVILINERWLPVSAFNLIAEDPFPESLQELIESGSIKKLQAFIIENLNILPESLNKFLIQRADHCWAPLLRHPSKIWGIGLNYTEHAGDLNESSPQAIPASFMKADTTIIGPGEPVELPLQSRKTTGEAELGIIIGKKCRDVHRENWLDVVAGFTSIIDMTAEDILRRNPRYLTLSKNFDTFFSYGPHLITADEIDDIRRLEVQTVINGEVHAGNIVANMCFPPDFLVSFHSRVMTLLPGDVISTGTPRAVTLNHGDTIECRISGFTSLKNPVIDLKQAEQKFVYP